MLCLESVPNKLLITKSKKLIILLKNTFILTCLDFIEQYLSKKLIYESPISIDYSDQSSQIIVISNEAIEIYQTDWFSEIALVKLCVFNHQKSLSCFWKKKWEAYGTFYQYGNKHLNLNLIQPFSENLKKCFINEFEFFIVNKKINAYDHLKQKKYQIQWDDNFNLQKLDENEINFQGRNCGDYMLLILNKKMCLGIRQWEVKFSLEDDEIVDVQNQLISTFSTKKKKLTIYEVSKEQIINLGEIEPHFDYYLTSFLVDKKLFMFYYDFKELIIRNIDLVDENTNIQYEEKKNKEEFNHFRRFNTFGDDISEIIQRQQFNLKDTLSVKNQFEKKITYNSMGHPVSLNDLKNQEGQKLSLRSETKSIKDSLKDTIQKFNFNLKKSFDIFNKKADVKEQQQQKLEKKQQIMISIGFESKEKIQEQQNAIVVQQMDLQSEQVSISEKLLKPVLIQRQSSKSQQDNIIQAMDQVEQINLNFQFTKQIQDDAQTPGFNSNLENRFGKLQDKWEWDQKKVDEGSRTPDFLKGNECSLSFNIFKSDKITYFAPKDQQLTAQVANTIINKKYTRLMSELYKTSQLKFNEYMYIFLEQIIKQEQARIFFAEHIRTFNPEITKDTILRLFLCLKDTEQNKANMIKSLSQFKINEIPRSCLPYSQEFIQIFLKIYPNVYIQDLLQPTIKLIENFIDSYFSIRQFSDSVLLIEDETIDIKYPRNILNLILYINLKFELQVQKIFQVYCSKIIIVGHSSIVKKMIEKKIFEICEVSRKILIEIIYNCVKELFGKIIYSMNYIQEIIGFVNFDFKKQEILNIAKAINLMKMAGAIFDVESVFNIPYNKNAINFLENLINDSPSRTLIRINVPQLFKMLWAAQDKIQLKFYNKNALKLAKMQAQKLFQKKYYKQAFDIIQPILVPVRRGFIGRLLKENLQGKYIDKLASLDLRECFLSEIFSQLCNGKVENVSRNFSEEKSSYLRCSYNYFTNKFSEILGLQSQQMIYALYQDLSLGLQLVEEGVFGQDFYQRLLIDLKENLTQKGLNSQVEVKVNIEKMKIPLQNIDNIENIDYMLNNTCEIYTKKNLNKDISMNIDSIKSLKQLSQDQFCDKLEFNKSFKSTQQNKKNQSAKNFNFQIHDDTLLMNLKMQVRNDEIINSLRQIYHNESRIKFMQALNVIDRQRVQIYNYDIIKSLFNLKLEFQYQRIIPFEFLTNKDYQEVWKIAKPKIIMELSVQNFWIIFLIIDMIFKKGPDVVKIIIQKVVLHQKDDESGDIISEICRKFKIDPTFLMEMIKQAETNCMFKVSGIIKQKYMDQLQS